MLFNERTWCCQALCNDCSFLDVHSHHIECVVNYSDGVSEVAKTTRNKIQKQIGLSKVWGTLLNQEILDLGNTESRIEQIGKAMKHKIDDNMHLKQKLK